MNKIGTFLIVLLSLPTVAFTQPCTAPTTGLVPINDLGTGTYAGLTGGLYPGGSNMMPSMHKTEGLKMAAQVQCLSNNGVPDAINGRIVWLSIGLSNTTQETQQFIPIANAYTGKNPKVTLVDGAQGGMTAQIISTPSHPNYTSYWSTIASRLAAAGVTSQQVQIIWLKSADQAASSPLWAHHDSLVERYVRIMHELKTRFPKVKICYLSSRISSRYATSPLNPEPYAYITGWAVKKVIERQITGDPQLQFAGVGANSPWLSWGCYMWSDGSTPQTTNPAVFWNCSTDFNTADYTHPSSTGALKAANMWLQFHTTDPTAKPWFIGSGCVTASSIGVKLYISGYFIGNGLMNSALYNQVVTNANPQQCDSVLIELHSTSPPYTVVASQPTVLSINGTCTVNFPFTGVFYISIKHRNGLETWSAEPVLCYDATTYDFSTSSAQAYGNNQVMLEANRYGLYSGDIIPDGTMDLFDYLQLDNDLIAGYTGYTSTDLNGDGSTDAYDYLILDLNVTQGIGLITPP